MSVIAVLLQRLQKTIFFGSTIGVLSPGIFFMLAKKAAREKAVPGATPQSFSNCSGWKNLSTSVHELPQQIKVNMSIENK